MGERDAGAKEKEALSKEEPPGGEALDPEGVGSGFASTPWAR